MIWILTALCLAFASIALYSYRRATLLDTAYRAAVESARVNHQRQEYEIGGLRVEHAALMEHCGAGALILDGGGIVLHANRMIYRLLGVRPQTLVGRPLFQATLLNELNGMVKAVRDEKVAISREMRVPEPNGSALLVSLVPVTEGPGPSHYLLIAQDLTELRRLETVRRDFVANVSHELRTPLASIRAMAETLQDGALNDASVAERFLSIIVTEAQRLTRIAEDLLILSTAESGLPETKTLDLTEMISAVVNRLLPQAEQAGLRLDTEVPAGLTVCANRDQIEQVLINLLDNAIKYTPAGGRVRVCAAREAERINVQISDTGIGIMSQDLPRIFERFYRVDKARSRQSGGTGLGLSIVKHIVESHGGQVTVESEYNRGSTFMFSLPSHGVEKADCEEVTERSLAQR